VEALGHRVAQAEEELEKLREITNTQKSQSDAQIERMEKELSRMRSGLGESVQLMVQREMAVNIEYVHLSVAIPVFDTRSTVLMFVIGTSSYNSALIRYARNCIRRLNA
jgi:SMC interacting uncharacterized protein involved in chromosome segregation